MKICVSIAYNGAHTRRSLDFFIADRTALTPMLQCCARRLSVVCAEGIVAKRCVLEQVTIDSYEKSIGTKMNDLDLCLEVVSRSCQPFRHIRYLGNR